MQFIMEQVVYKTRRSILKKTSLWEAFTLYLEKMYFPGAIEKLESGLVRYEYEYFKSQHLF